MISPAAIAKYGKDIAQHPVGTGPFVFVEWKPTDYVKVAKFDGYWRKGNVDVVCRRYGVPTVGTVGDLAAWVARQCEEARS